MTEIPTMAGKLYVATVIDLYSRRLLGAAKAARCLTGSAYEPSRVAHGGRGRSSGSHRESTVGDGTQQDVA